MSATYASVTLGLGNSKKKKLIKQEFQDERLFTTDKLDDGPATRLSA